MLKKSPENFEKSKMHKNNRQNSENNIFYKKRNLCREIYSRPPVYQIWRIYLDLWGYDCKKWVWPTFGCKLGQSDPIVMQLKLNMSCHLLNVYTKFEIDISKHVEEKSGKRGRTDGRTLPRHNTSVFQTGRAYKNHCETGLYKNFFVNGFFCIGISIIKGKMVRYHQIFTMGIFVLVRQHLYIEMAPGACHNISRIGITIHSWRPSDACMHQ